MAILPYRPNRLLSTPPTPSTSVPKYVIDSNVYIAAFRDPSKAAELKQFLAGSLSFTYFLAIVALDLRAGVQTRDQLAAFDEIIGPFARRGRFIAPSADAYTEGGRILAELRRRDNVRAGDTTSSFINDVMIAVTCRENGLTLITNNASDFTLVRGPLRSFAFVPPWPTTR